MLVWGWGEEKQKGGTVEPEGDLPVPLYLCFIALTWLATKTDGIDHHDGYCVPPKSS